MTTERPCRYCGFVASRMSDEDCPAKPRRTIKTVQPSDVPVINGDNADSDSYDAHAGHVLRRLFDEAEQRGVVWRAGAFDVEGSR